MAETKVEETPRKILLNAVQVTFRSFTHNTLYYQIMCVDHLLWIEVVQNYQIIIS